jgi:ABC-type amino acid transport substrate-binding protein
VAFVASAWRPARQAIVPLAITAERQQTFDFSAPILMTGGALFVRAPVEIGQPESGFGQLFDMFQVLLNVLATPNAPEGGAEPSRRGVKAPRMAQTVARLMKSDGQGGGADIEFAPASVGEKDES